jgi:hypothetical protein
MLNLTISNVNGVSVYAVSNVYLISLFFTIALVLCLLSGGLCDMFILYVLILIWYVILLCILYSIRD